MTGAWKCEVCGYVHAAGEPPAVCPVCGAGRELFAAFAVPGAPAPARATAWRCTVCGFEQAGEAPPGVCPVCGAGASLFEPAGAAAPAAASGSALRLVVLGAGIAGVTAAEHARRTAAGAEITLVSKEPGLPYYRLNLTRYLAAEVSAESLALHDDGWYREHRIRRVEGEAVEIDRAAKRLRLRDGTTLEYDRLVLANGSHPFIPPIPGATREGVMTLRTRGDAEAIARRGGNGARCLCIGGGLLGLETAGALARRGAQVTILEGFGWLLPRQLPEPAGRRLAEQVARRGLAVRCGVKVEEICGDEAASGVRLGGGEFLPAELVVIAAGVRPNSHLARRAELPVKSGVLVDDRMATADPDLFAAGDAAEHRGVVYGIWPTAYAQGVTAGVNAAGGAAEFPGLAPSNRLKVLDVDLFSIGPVQPADASWTVRERDEPGRYVRLVLHDGRLAGAALYGDTGASNRVREAVESGRQVSELPELAAAFPWAELA